MRDRENTSQPFFTDYKLNHLELKDFVVEIFKLSYKKSALSKEI